MIVPLFRKASRDSLPARTQQSAIRYRIETVFGQLCERFSAERVWARNLWHLSSRPLRKVLAIQRW